MPIFGRSKNVPKHIAICPRVKIRIFLDNLAPPHQTPNNYIKELRKTNSRLKCLPYFGPHLCWEIAGLGNDVCPFGIQRFRSVCLQGTMAANNGVVANMPQDFMGERIPPLPTPALALHVVSIPEA